MQLHPYLNFNGQCEAALRFYEQTLGAKIITQLTYGDSPLANQVPLDWRHKILHATLHVGDRVLMGCDPPPERYEKPQGFSVTLSIKGPEHAERIFAELSENGTVTLPLQQTFWAVRFGMVTDQFGIPWMINCEQS